MRVRRAVANHSSVVRARRAVRIAMLKIVWAVGSIALLSSIPIELTQPHPSRWTFLFVVAWVAFSVGMFNALRRARQEP